MVNQQDPCTSSPFLLCSSSSSPHRPDYSKTEGGEAREEAASSASWHSMDRFIFCLMSSSAFNSRFLFKSHIILMMLLSCASFVSGRGFCFKTDLGLSIEGGNYRRMKNSNLESCRIECLDDISCFGFEWNSQLQTCYLKSRSTSGKFVSKENTLIGICMNPDDEDRYRLQDHVLTGEVKVEFENVSDNEEHDECKTLCRHQMLPFYSWKPNDLQNINEYERFGKCSCMEKIHGVSLEFDAFAGFVPLPRKHRRSLIWKTRGAVRQFN